MQELTISIDDEVFAAAEAFASERETTVTGLVTDYLSRLRREARAIEARKELLRLMDTTTGSLDSGFKWNREDAYAERIDRLFSRHEHPGLRRPEGSE